MHTRMKTNEELLAEVESMNLPEQLKETFRRVINTVESELTEDQWRDYELDLEKYQRTMSEFRTARQEGREEGREEAKLEIARAMLQKGLSLEVIAECTKLSPTEISALSSR